MFIVFLLKIVLYSTKASIVFECVCQLLNLWSYEAYKITGKIIKKYQIGS